MHNPWRVITTGVVAHQNLHSGIEHWLRELNSISSTGADIEEIQANGFAAALLMPEELVRQELESMDFDLGDEDALLPLADKFEVSSQSMSIWFGSLDIFSSDPETTPDTAEL